MIALIQKLIPRVTLLLLTLGLTGCLEVESQVEIRKDGSGRIESELHLSDRMVVSMMSAEKDSTVKVGKGMPFDEASLREMLGAEAEILKLDVEELPDGSRRITYSAEVPDIISFLNKEDKKANLGIRIVKLDDGHAALEFSGGMESKGSMKLELEQMYGLMKGLYVNTTVRMPVELSSKTGLLSSDKRSITWGFDLRDLKGLAEAKAEKEQLDGKLAQASFSLTNLDWDQGKLVAPKEPTPDPEGGIKHFEYAKSAKGLRARVGVVSTTHNELFISKKVFKKNRFRFRTKDELKLHILLDWVPDAQPLSYGSPVLEEIITDTGENLLLTDETQGGLFPHPINWTKVIVVEASAKLPSKEASAIRLVKGYVPVRSILDTELVRIPNPASKVGSGIIDNQAMKQVGAYLKSVEGNKVEVVCRGEMVDDAALLKSDGSRLVGSRAHVQNKNEYTYSYKFGQPIAVDDVFEIRVFVSDTSIKVPFSAQDLELP